MKMGDKEPQTLIFYKWDIAPSDKNAQYQSQCPTSNGQTHGFPLPQSASNSQ